MEYQVGGFLSQYDKNTVGAEELGIYDTGSELGNVDCLP